AVTGGEIYTSLFDLGHHAPAFRVHRLLRPCVALGQPVLIVDPERIAIVRGVIVGVVDNLDPLIEVPHRVVDFEPEFLPQPYVVLERRCEVAQHRIVLGGQGDEVDRAGRHDLILAPVQVFQGHRHVQRRANVQADGQAMQLRHDDVFEAASDQLLAAPEDLGPYEPGYIVDV